ncbi:oxidoreductase, FAD-binding protein [Roseovarius sp. TM1035]|jgi:D-arginine dehydrogenase|uniref:NAD(P)/FAD-dependent oxidoreductase n=1 Tax=Roseovarius sp. TM1035 TaxID=391613 RepID=UPI00015570EC|nr:FAD-dependent oxidoreductase [Roseovarius sp. TM1035]EDM31483.1 oxidoreductase, FAD-binding protein [Roseovarius sp. TM1035]
MADVIVIGGGIAGISAAAELARGGADVLVLEMEGQIGYHATGRSAAIFIRNYGNATLRALNAVAEPIFEQPGEISDQPLLSPRGELMVASEEELPILDAYLDGSTGIDRLTGKEAAEIVPILRADRIAGAMIERGARGIDVDRLLQGYARMLRARGGRIVTGAVVTGLSHRAGLWQVKTAQEQHSAPIIINAAGSWADEVSALAGVPRAGLQPYRRSAAIIPTPQGYETEHWPIFGSIAETWYAKPEAGKLMVSPADEDPVEPHDAWADDMVLAEGLHRFEQAVSVPVTRVEHSWAGLRTFAPDRTPVVGFDPRATGFFWLAGQGGYGVQTAPALSRLTAALIAGVAPDVSSEVLAAMEPGRFGLE